MSLKFTSRYTSFMTCAQNGAWDSIESIEAFEFNYMSLSLHDVFCIVTLVINPDTGHCQPTDPRLLDYFCIIIGKLSLGADEFAPGTSLSKTSLALGPFSPLSQPKGHV